MSTEDRERDRIRTEYARRFSGIGPDLYSLFDPAYQFMTFQRQKATTALLRDAGIYSLDGKRILEVGCGRGDILQEFLAYRIDPALLFGLDLLPGRLGLAHRRFPTVNLSCGDGQYLPYRDDSFDVVAQYTVFSSILIDPMKQRIAIEMQRVVKKNTGIILWYDFWINPTNAQTRGLLPDEIRRLFPGCNLTIRKITLAPPIARRLVKFSWVLGELLEKSSVLSTHFLVLIRAY